MTQVRRSCILDAPLEAVWDILRDFNSHAGWHPAVAQSVIEHGGLPDAVGAVRDFRLADGSRIREQLLALSDRDHNLTHCIIEAPLPLRNCVAQIRLRPVTDSNSTFWEWTGRFDPPVHASAALARLVAEDIYEAGFRALRKHLGVGLSMPLDNIAAKVVVSASADNIVSSGSLVLLP